MAEPKQLADCNGVKDECLQTACTSSNKWNFSPSDAVMGCSHNMLGIRGVLDYVMSHLNHDGKSKIPLGHGDPSAFECFRTSVHVEDALIEAIRTGKYNGYSPGNGLPQSRRVVADYLSRGLPFKLSEDDVYLTCGCSQAIDLVLSVLAREGANILLPRPGFPAYEALMAYKGIEARHYDLVPERGWEINLDQLHTIADSNTVAMVIINPSNPCGTTFTHDHLAKVAETAKRLGLLIISDEVYAHIVFGEKPFIPMGFFASTVPVITLGSISKKWMVPGWRIGWLATCDPDGILRKSQITEGIKKLLNIVVDPSTIAQAAIPQIIKKTPEDFYQQTLQLLSHAADICYDRIQKIDVFYCPAKPEGSMFVMVKINISGLVDIRDDIEFSAMLAKEESVIVLPGSPLGLKNWIRVTFAISPSVLEEGLERIAAFCMRHAKNT